MKIENLLHEQHRRLERHLVDGDRRVRKHRGRHDREREKEFLHHSVINGSKVHSASVVKTTSNARSRPIQSVATGSSGGVCSSAAVPRTPAMMTGIVTGYNRIGRSTSRSEEHTSELQS